MADVDQNRMKSVILELEEDGADHAAAEIDPHVEQAFGITPEELLNVHQTNRSAFDTHVDWAKAALTKELLHKIVGAFEGQNIYRITDRGRDEIIRNKRHRELKARAYGLGKKSDI